jgi:L-fucose isomerase-like protein
VIGCARMQARVSVSVHATSTATAHSKRELSREFTQSCVRMYARTLDTHCMARRLRREVTEKWSAAHVVKRESVRSRSFTSSCEHDTTTHSQEVRSTVWVCLHCGSFTAQTNPRKAKEGLALLAWRQLPHRGGGAVVWAQVMQSGCSAQRDITLTSLLRVLTRASPAC